MRTLIEKITPEIATKYLQGNRINRRLNAYMVNRLAREMTEGRFIENTGEAIKISKDGFLIDGQHRLSAIVKSGKTFSMLVIKDLNENVIRVLDTGKARSAGDLLQISGAKNANRLSSTIALIKTIDNGIVSARSKDTGLTNQQILDIYKSDVDYWEDLMLKANNYYSKSMIIEHSFVGAFYHIFNQKNADKCESFFDELMYGVNLAENNPILILRNKMIQEKSSNRKFTPFAKRVFIIKTWNAYITGKRLGVLKYILGESQPEILPK